MSAIKVGFVGVGKMGQPMVAHLRRAGVAVMAFDLLAENLSQAQVLGCHVAESLTQCASWADVLVSSLPDDTALAAITGGNAHSQNIFDHLRIGTVYVDTSTVSPAASAAVATRTPPHVAYLRATVSGNPVTAQAGNLTLMASGPREAYERVQPLCAHFCKTQFYLGEAEQARVAKLVINLMVAVSAGMIAEALVLGEQGGLERAQLLDLMAQSAVGSPLVHYKIPPLKAHDYTSTFSGNQMLKDLDLILDAGAQNGVPLALAAHMRGVYEAMRGAGLGELDYIATVRALESGTAAP